MSRKRQTHVACTSEAGALALADYLMDLGYWASADGASVRTDAQLGTVLRAPSGLML